MGVTVDKLLGRPLLHGHQAGDISPQGSGSGLDADTVDGQQGLLVDTRANILATVSPATGQAAYATDVARFYVYDGSDWREAALQWSVRSGQDMGYEQNSGLQGYGLDYVTDKRLSNVLLGGNARTENGGMRVDVDEDPDTLEIYLRDGWQTIIYDLTTDDGDFRHTPIAEQIYVWRGDSVAVGLNGRPLVQEYEASMGAYPATRLLVGGTF